MAKDFFFYFPEQIFSPLAGGNKKLYLDILMSLYHRFFNETADYDDVSFAARTIRDHIEAVIRAAQFWVDEDTGKQESIAEITDIEQRAYYLYQRLVECGWLRVERQGHKDHVFVSEQVVELFQFLDSAGRDLSKHVGGSVLSVYRNLNGILDPKATGPDIVVSLEQAVDESKNMARRMNRLARRLREFTEKISEIPDTSQKADTFFNDFINESSFADYNDIKKKNHPMRFKADIISLLQNIEFTSDNRRKVIESLREDLTIGVNAEIKLDESLTAIRRVFINTDGLLDRIDKTHVKLVHRFNDSLRYRRRTGTNLKVHIEDAFKALKKVDDLDGVDIVNSLPEIGAISVDSLYKLKRQKRKLVRDSGNKERKVSAEELLKNKLHRDYLRKMTVNPDKLNDWLEDILQDNQIVSSLNIQIESPEEFALFIQARRLCSGNTFFYKKFRAILEQFSFTVASEYEVEHEVVYCREFSIQRRTNFLGHKSHV